MGEDRGETVGMLNKFKNDEKITFVHASSCTYIWHMQRLAHGKPGTPQLSSILSGSARLPSTSCRTWCLTFSPAKSLGFPLSKCTAHSARTVTGVLLQSAGSSFGTSQALPCAICTWPQALLWSNREFSKRGNLASLVLHLLRGEVLRVIQTLWVTRVTSVDKRRSTHDPGRFHVWAVGLRNTKSKGVKPI